MVASREIERAVERVMERDLLRGSAASGPSVTVAPAITGTAEIGETLTCSTGTWEGTGTITYAYQWRRDGAEIDGAESSTYELVSADDETDVSCTVTATDDNGSTPETADAVAVTYPAPVASEGLSNQSFTEDTGVETYDVSGDFTGSDLTFSLVTSTTGVSIAAISGVVSVDTDATGLLSGETITVRAANSGGYDDSSFDLTVAAAVSAPEITSVVLDGNDLDVFTDRDCDLSYLVNTSSSAVAATIYSTGTTVEVTGSEANLTIETNALAAGTYYIHLVAHDDGSNFSAVDSTATFEVTAPSNTVAPAISGAFIEGQTLSVTTGTWTQDPSSYSYQWTRDDVDISGATSSTYELVGDDVGAEVDCDVTATNGAGSTEVSATGEDTVAAAVAIDVTYGSYDNGYAATYTPSAVANNPGDLLVVYVICAGQTPPTAPAGYTRAVASNFGVYTKTSAGTNEAFPSFTNTATNTLRGGLVITGAPSSVTVGTPAFDYPTSSPISAETLSADDSGLLLIVTRANTVAFTATSHTPDHSDTKIAAIFQPESGGNTPAMSASFSGTKEFGRVTFGINS